MSIAPLITFKAGMCEDVGGSSGDAIRVKPQETPGYIYVYSEDELLHFCWRKRSTSIDEPELDLIMVAADGSFLPYQPHPDKPSSKTNGRIFVLKFESSSARHFFWLQSKPQARTGDPTWFSPRDKKIGWIVHSLLQGVEVDVDAELARLPSSNNNNRNDRNNDDDDDDETMEDVEGHGDRNQPHGGGGGAGPGATGGDVREEGEDAREGGGDGARAPTDADAAVRSFLQSLQGNANLGGGGQQQQQQQQQADKPYPHLNHLLPNEETLPMLRNASEDSIDSMLSFLPPAILILATESGDPGDAELTDEAAAAARASLSLAEKKGLLEKVLRSPQFHQGLGSLTMAIRDGGLPTIAEALNVKVANGGYMRGAGMPLGGGEAVEAFVEGVKETVKENQQK